MELPIAPQGVLTEDKAWLLGFVAGDGHVRNVKREKKIAIACGKDESLAHECARLFDLLYGVPTTVHKDMKNWPRTFCWMAICYRGAVVFDFLSLAPFGIYRWRVPKSVREGTDQIKSAWIAGFTDAEGCVQHKPEISKRVVSIDGVNLEGMNEIRTMLTELGIEHSMYTHDRKNGHSKGYKINVQHFVALQRFAALIPLRCPRKKQGLFDAIESYERRCVLREAEVEAMLPVIKQRVEERCHSLEDIADELGVSRESVRSAMRTHGIQGPGSGFGKRYWKYAEHWSEVERLINEERWTVRRVAERFGWKETGLSHVMQVRGMKIGERRGAQTLRSREIGALMPQIKALWEQGKTNVEITEAVGLAPGSQTVSQLLHQHGLVREDRSHWRRRDTDESPPAREVDLNDLVSVAMGQLVAEIARLMDEQKVTRTELAHRFKLPPSAVVKAFAAGDMYLSSAADWIKALGCGLHLVAGERTIVVGDVASTHAAFTDAVSALLAAHGTTRAAFARLLGKSPANVTQTLGMVRDLHLGKVVEWLHALGCAVTVRAVPLHDTL